MSPHGTLDESQTPRAKASAAQPPPIPDEARCLGCGYALRELTSSRCPECGRSFDPADAATMRLVRAPSRVALWWMRPPGWPLIGSAAVALLLTAYALSPPGTFFGLLMLLNFPWCLIVVALLVRAGLATAFSILYRDSPLRRPTPWLRWVVVPAVIALAFVMARSGFPRRAAFALSRPALDRFAARILADTQPPPEDAWVGLYPVEQVERFPPASSARGMRFLVRGTGFLDRFGFAFSPAAPPPDLGGEDGYTPIGDGWYVWRESW